MGPRRVACRERILMKHITTMVRQSAPSALCGGVFAAAAREENEA